MDVGTALRIGLLLGLAGLGWGWWKVSEMSCRAILFGSLLGVVLAELWFRGAGPCPTPQDAAYFLLLVVLSCFLTGLVTGGKKGTK